MRIRVLGAHGGALPNHRTTCFVLDGVVAVDAGSLCALTIEEQVRISDVFLTHCHLDHVKDLPLMTDNVILRRPTPVMVRGPQQTIVSLDQDVFNDRLWPDFRAIPTREAPVVRIEKLAPRTPVVVGEFRFTGIPVTHPVESYGYIVEQDGKVVAFSGDTGPTEAFWLALNAMPRLDALFVETSFPDQLQAVADASGHFTPSTLALELKTKLERRGARIFVHHLKPAFVPQIKQELAALAMDLRVCENDDEYEI